jgi:hypothetical protein
LSARVHGGFREGVMAERRGKCIPGMLFLARPAPNRALDTTI